MIHVSIDIHVLRRLNGIHHLPQNLKYNDMGHKLLFSNEKIQNILALRFKHFSPILKIYYFPPITLYRGLDLQEINVIKKIVTTIQSLNSLSFL